MLNRRMSGWCCLAVMIFLGAVARAQTLPAAPSGDALVTRIGFGSCWRQGNPTPIWDAINAANCDTFIFLGDNVYADTEDPVVFKAKYAALGAEAGFQTLCKTSRVLATWDDHDYGKNDAGAEFVGKRASREAFLEFWKIPADSPRRGHEGIYDAVSLGPEGKRVQVILLDGRWFRSPWKLNPDDKAPFRKFGPYMPTDETTATMLGDEQWKWLEAKLREPAEVRVIASGSQVICNFGGSEAWGLMPHERKRLFEIISKTKANGVVFISGDRHFAEISLSREGPYPFYDVTSSSFNAPRGGPREAAEWRVGTSYTGVNFGVIEIDWSAPAPVLSLQVRDVNGEKAIEARVSLKELSKS